MLNIEAPHATSEQQCHAIILGIMSRLVPSIRDVVEVGLGTNNFLFPEAVRAGAKCHLVEPLPTPELLTAINALGMGDQIKLHEKALTQANGTASMTLGRTPDLCSLNPEWWGRADADGGTYKTVAAVNLETLCHESEVGPIACLKIDVEGCEWDIIQQITPERRPQVVMFEYGGTPQAGRQGGWTSEAINNTCRCIGKLSGLGYRTFNVVETGVAPKHYGAFFVSELERFRDGKSRRVFNGADYGNILAILPSACAAHE